MPKYWIAVASAEHVMRGVVGGFMQVCHGKVGPLKRISAGDGILYYSPHEIFGEKTPCRQFTAVGWADESEPYEYAMSDDFIPWRRNVTFSPAQRVAIEPLLDKLSFIHNKQRWGFPFRRGCFEIPHSDFQLIAAYMGVSAGDKVS